MPRLIQGSNVTQQNTPVGVSQSAQTISPNVSNVVTPEVSGRRSRYPHWFSSVRLVAVILTVWQVGQWLSIQGQGLAIDRGWKPGVKHTLTLPMPDDARYALTPQGDKYLVGYRNGDDSQMKLYKSSGELLWSQDQFVDNPVFSSDGSHIFSGTEMLETATGKVAARIPLPRYIDGITWASGGNKAAWQIPNSIQVWDRATNKTRALSLKKGDSIGSTLSLSPNGRWLTTIAYKEGYKSRVAVWDLTKSAEPELYPLANPIGGAYGLTFSPDSRKLLYAGRQSNNYPGGSKERVSLWTLDKSQSVYEFYPEHAVQSAAWSPDGRNFVLRGREEWSVYNAPSGNLLWSGSYHTNSFLNELYFTQDNKIYYYDYSKNEWTLEYWDLAKVIKK